MSSGYRAARRTGRSGRVRGRRLRSARSRPDRRRAAHPAAGCSRPTASSTPRTTAPSSSGSRRIGMPGRPLLACQPNELRPHGVELPRGIRHQPLGRERLGPHRVAHLAGEQLRTDPTLPLARRQDDLAQVRLEVGQCGPCRLGGGAQPRQDGRNRGIRAGRGIGARQRLVDQATDPRTAARAPSRSGTARPGARHAPRASRARPR